MGYEGFYQASSLGNIRSLDRIVQCKAHSTKLKGRQLSQRLNGSYLSCGLCVKGVKKTFWVHRLVAQSFFLNPDQKPQVNHINGIKTDNRACNLEWCTSKENSVHAVKMHLFKRKLTDAQVVKIYNLYCEGADIYHLANQYNVHYTTISNIGIGKSFRHLGLKPRPRRRNR